jgi:ACS family glucarate transporter-like MFS transporter
MKRYAVVFLLCVLALILYVDRVCISSAKAMVAGDLGLTDQAMGIVFGAFSLGYALGQIPAGWFADRVGPRIALAAVVIAWSLFTGLTGAARGYTTLIVVRFLFGLGEAGCFPGSARVFSNWLPASERGIANGLTFSGSRIGAAFAYLLLPGVLDALGWRATFVVLGAAGVVWGTVWLLWFRDHPERPVAQAPEPTVGGRPLAFGEILRSPPMTLAMLQYFASNFTFYLGLSWMVPYLTSRYRLTPAEAGRYAMAPLLIATTSLWATGLLVDRIYRSRHFEWSRRFPAMLGFLLGIVGLVMLTRSATPQAAVVALTLAIYGVDMTVPPSWTHCVDIAGKNAGAVSGSMNAVGNLGSFLSAFTFPYLLARTGTPDTYFFVAAALNGVGLVSWIWMRPAGGLKKA